MRKPPGRLTSPVLFAIALETLAVKAFGDMGQTARLRLIRDRFIAGHNSCELSRHLDSVPPETPIRDIVDRCRVWESHADPTRFSRLMQSMSPIWEWMIYGWWRSPAEVYAGSGGGFFPSVAGECSRLLVNECSSSSQNPLR